MTQGLLAEIRDGRRVTPVLIVGTGVPRIHSADRVPVYLVTVNPRGSLLRFKDKRTAARLVAYPSSWPGPGEHGPQRYVFAQHELLAFDAPVPVFDKVTP